MGGGGGGGRGASQQGERAAREPVWLTPLQSANPQGSELNPREGSWKSKAQKELLLDSLSPRALRTPKSVPRQGGNLLVVCCWFCIWF